MRSVSIVIQLRTLSPEWDNNNPLPIDPMKTILTSALLLTSLVLALPATAQTTVTYNLASLGTGLAWDTSELYSTGVVSVVTAVPEPSAYAAIFGVCVLGFATCRRRRATKLS